MRDGWCEGIMIVKTNPHFVEPLPASREGVRQTAVTWRDALSKAIASKLITLDHAIARGGAVTAKPLEVF